MGTEFPVDSLQVEFALTSHRFFIYGTKQGHSFFPLSLPFVPVTTKAGGGVGTIIELCYTQIPAVMLTDIVTRITYWLQYSQAQVVVLTHSGCGCVRGGPK